MASAESRLFPDFVQNGEMKYNVMLLNIAKELYEEDLRRLKFILSGPCGISTREIKLLTTAEEFFMCLKQRMMLTRDNLLLLQALMRYIDRKDLQEIVENYARESGDTLYFYEPPRQPENGFKRVQFHVDGNLKSFQRPTLEKLKEYVARLLNVPQEFIFLVGVKEGSIILIFMISEQYADQLKDLFENHKDSFVEFGVVGIFVIEPPAIDVNLERLRLRERNKTLDDEISKLRGELERQINQKRRQVNEGEKTFGEMVQGRSGLHEEVQKMGQMNQERLRLNEQEYKLVNRERLRVDEREKFLDQMKQERRRLDEEKLTIVKQERLQVNEQEKTFDEMVQGRSGLHEEVQKMEWKRNRSRPKDSTYSSLGSKERKPRRLSDNTYLSFRYEERKPRRLSDNTYLSFRYEGKRESQQKVTKDHTGFQKDYPSSAETK